MKAAQYSKYGEPEVIEINENAPKPSPSKAQVLVEVYAVSLNPFDSKLRLGYMKNMIPLQFPVTIGGDFSGVVKEEGEGVTEFKIGDEIYGQALVLNGGSGVFAEFTVANVKNTAPKPKNFNHTTCASLPLVGSSAIQALEEHINLKSKQKILIHGGSGGIGSIAVQLAKSKGAYVATTVSTDGVEFVKKLGADQIINYEKEAFESKLSDFDAVFDTVGKDVTDKSFKVLKKGGILVSMTGQPNAEEAKQYGVTAIGQMTNTNTKNLIRLAELVDNDTIKPQIDKVFSLDEAKEAFDYLEKGHPKGKVVVKIKE